MASRTDKKAPGIESLAALSLVRFHDGVNLIISQHQNYRYWVLQTLADCGLAFSQDRLTAGSHRHHCSDRRDDALVAEQHVSE